MAKGKNKAAEDQEFVKELQALLDKYKKSIKAVPTYTLGADGYYHHDAEIKLYDRETK